MRAGSRRRRQFPSTWFPRPLCERGRSGSRSFRLRDGHRRILVVARVISGNIQSIAIWLKGSVPMTALYDTDLVAWAREQADLARRGSVNSLDLVNIAEELEGMVRAEHRAL